MEIPAEVEVDFVGLAMMALEVDMAVVGVVVATKATFIYEIGRRDGGYMEVVILATMVVIVVIVMVGIGGMRF